MIKPNLQKLRDFSALTVGGLIFLVAFNLLIFLAFGDANIDLTKDKKFSLSKDTTDFLDENKTQMNIKFFVSKDLKNKNPKLAEYAEYLRKILVEYRIILTDLSI